MKKKVGVLHVQVPFVRGGAELMVENLTRELRKRDYDAELISMPFKWYPPNVLLDNYMLWRTVDLTESNGEKLDLLITAKAPTYMVQHPNKVLWLMHQHRMAYDLQDNRPAGGLNTVPGGWEAKEKVIAMDNLGISETKAVYSISKTVTDRLKAYNGIGSKVLYHPPSLVGRYFTEEYGDYILSVGRLDLMKRVDLIIRALQYTDKNVKAMIAGRGSDLERLQKLAAECGVEDRVKFLGFVDDEQLLKLYAGALAVCFPPVDEDYGYITLEAFLSKKPIISCKDSGGVLEFVEDGKSGFIGSYKNPEEIGEYFNKLYHNKELAREMGNAGYETVKDISWDNVIDELTKTLR